MYAQQQDISQRPAQDYPCLHGLSHFLVANAQVYEEVIPGFQVVAAVFRSYDALVAPDTKLVLDRQSKKVGESHDTICGRRYFSPRPPSSPVFSFCFWAAEQQ